MLILLGLVFISANLLAQVTAKTCDQHVMGAKRTYYKYTGVAADTCGTEQDTLYFEIQANKNTALTCNARIEVTRTGSTETYGLDLEGKVFANDTWTKIVENNAASASVSLYEPSTSLVDSVNQATINSGNSDNYYRYFRVFVDNDGTCGAADKLTIDAVIFKLYER